jgi:hypothetical protein
MQYSPIDDRDKEHLLKLIDWLYQEVKRSGGDGDALWYSRFYDIKDILVLVNEYNDKLKYKWTVELDQNRNLISWGSNQEYVMITNTEEYYKTSPSWQQCIVVL